MFALHHTLRRPALVVGLLLAFAAPAIHAQEVRQRLLDSALALPDPGARVAVLVRAIDPNLGVPDQRWVRAVAKLVEDLAIEMRDPNAHLWLRWAVRLYPQFSIDPVETEDEVIALLLRVRREVGDLTSPDTLATWDWAGVRLSGDGTLRVNRAAVPPDALVRVVDGGPLTDPLRLAPNTYDVEVSLGGRIYGRFPREVLPGVTTTLNFRFPAAAAVMEQPGQPAGTNIPPQTVRRGGKFPTFAVLGGIGAAGIAAALLLGRGGGTPDPATTGGIIINYPLP